LFHQFLPLTGEPLKLPGNSHCRAFYNYQELEHGKKKYKEELHLSKLPLWKNPSPFKIYFDSTNYILLAVGMFLPSSSVFVLLSQKTMGFTLGSCYRTFSADRSLYSNSTRCYSL
jgi:hypothetical protein